MSVVQDAPRLILQLLSEVYGVVSQSEDMLDLEQGVHRIVSQTTRELLEKVLQERDEELAERRDKKALRMVGRRTRSLLTPMGEIRLERAYYREAKTGRGVFLLDAGLSLSPHQRLSPWLEQLVVRTVVDLPYHRAQKLLCEVIPGLPVFSAMAAWTAVQREGSVVVQRADERRQQLFEWGEVPAGTRQTEQLGLEADEVLVRSRQSGKGKIGLKVAAAYEGKEPTGVGRRRLVERQVTVTVGEAETFWEHTVAETGRKWDLSCIQRTTVGGDGARWVKQGLEHFPGSVYRLDPYHLRRALVEALGRDHASYPEVCAGIATSDWPRVEAALRGALQQGKKEKQDNIRRLVGYLRSNWEGIVESQEAQNLGAIEGQVFHHVARRMKRHGARWSRSGANHLAWLLAARANGELFHDRAKPSACPDARPPLGGRSQAAVQAFGPDPGEWLAASLPSLTGPHADRPWVKWCLRQLARTPKLA